MVTEYEAHKLVHDMRDELEVTPDALIRYSAGALAILVVVTVGIFG